MDRPPLSLSHRYKEGMDFHQKIVSVAFFFAYQQQRIHVLLAVIIKEHIKAADILLCKGSRSKYYDIKLFKQ